MQPGAVPAGLDGLLGEGQQDLVPAPEVLVERAMTDAGRLDDVGDGGGVVALLGEQLAGGLEQQPAGLGAARRPGGGARSWGAGLEACSPDRSTVPRCVRLAGRVVVSGSSSRFVVTGSVVAGSTGMEAALALVGLAAAQCRPTRPHPTAVSGEFRLIDAVSARRWEHVRRPELTLLSVPVIVRGRRGMRKEPRCTRPIACRGMAPSTPTATSSSPPTCGRRYLEPQYRDRALRVVKDENGLDELSIGGQRSTMSRRGFPSTLAAMGRSDLGADGPRP